MATNSMVSSVLPMNSLHQRRRNRSKGLAVSCAQQQVSSPGVQLTEGEGKLPKVLLKSANGCEADIYLFGGCVTSWKIASGKDLLFVRPDAKFDGKKPISGGMPHCFPQFGPGPIQQHGFARNMNWSIVDFSNADGNPIITLELRDAPYSRSMWDFSFQALYTVRLNPKSLSTELTIKNTDSKPFSFNTALHTYFSGSVTGASVKSLKGCKTLNKDPDPKNPLESIEDRDVITFPGFVDCVYLNAPSQLELNNGLGETITLKNTNWSDCVLWNPHLTMEHCYKDFVCVENAKLAFYTLNSSRSAYQAITFNPHFFDVYTILAVQVRCSILLKTIVVEFWWFVELRFGFTPISAKKDQASLWFQKDCTNRVQSYDWASCSWRQLRNPCSRLEMHTYSCFSYILAATFRIFLL